MSVPALSPPPIRVCLEDAFTRAAGGRDDPTPAIEKQWYLYWSGLANRLNGLVSYGRSDQRPDPGSVPDGALYGQIDPGYVIYQSIEGEWHYVAGTMYATLNPDQRPVGLGPNDAGFDFRAVDTDPQYSGREFIWSGSVWVEATQARFGTHAARVALVPANIVNGMLYVETDRSEVIYQNQGGTWHFVAGTMWGTLSPDQRPTGLGANDAGFDFRSTDTDPLLTQREFIWSGTVWVEATIVQYGTHAARPAGTAAPARCLYVETDRSEVLYQNQATVWHFVAGTMWGTVVPDQRPTDLGVNDAGFTFRGTDVARSFVWSGTAWVETTPSAPPLPNTVQVAFPSAGLTLTTAMQDIPGLTLTLATAGIYWVQGIFDLTVTVNDPGNTLNAQLLVNGGAATGLAFYNVAQAPAHAMIPQQWRISVGAGAVIKCQANKNGGTGTSSAGGHCTLMALWVSP